MDATIWVALITAIGAVAVAIINALCKAKSNKEEIGRQAEATRKKLEQDKQEYQNATLEQNAKLDEYNLKLDAQNDKLDEIIKGNEELKEGTMQLLGSEIDRVYFKYKGKESIPLSEYQNIKQIFEIYDKLGGNGERRKHWMQIDHLPVVDDEK